MKLKQLRNILFLDIETVCNESSFENLNPRMQALWKKKSRSFSPSRIPFEGKELKESYLAKAGIYAEFSKIVCITVAYVTVEKKKLEKLRLKSFFGHDESALLKEFCALVNNFYYNPSKHYFSGHNIKEFDIPFLARRMLINRIPLPALFDIRGKKPWQVDYLIDTLEMWRFGDYKNYTSLDLLANALGIESPKDEMNGSQVSFVYHNEQDLEKIVRYCEKDVKTTVHVLMRMSGFEPIEEDKIESLSFEP